MEGGSSDQTGCWCPPVGLEVGGGGAQGGVETFDG